MANGTDVQNYPNGILSRLQLYISDMLEHEIKYGSELFSNRFGSQTVVVMNFFLIIFRRQNRHMDAYERSVVNFRNTRGVLGVCVENRPEAHDESRTDAIEVRFVNLQRHSNAVQQLALVLGKLDYFTRHFIRSYTYIRTYSVFQYV